MGFPTKRLNNGVEMPVLGLGIYLMENLNEMKQAVESALKAGYRSLDTAQTESPFIGYLAGNGKIISGWPCPRNWRV